MQKNEQMQKSNYNKTRQRLEKDCIVWWKIKWRYNNCFNIQQNSSYFLGAGDQT